MPIENYNHWLKNRNKYKQPMACFEESVNDDALVMKPAWKFAQERNDVPCDLAVKKGFIHQYIKGKRFSRTAGKVILYRVGGTLSATKYITTAASACFTLATKEKEAYGAYGVASHDEIGRSVHTGRSSPSE